MFSAFFYKSYSAKNKIIRIIVKKISFYKIIENFDRYFKIKNQYQYSKEKRI